jgi:hypothetical protein
MKSVSLLEYQPIPLLTSTEKNLQDQLRGPRNGRLFQVGWRETWATLFVDFVQLPQTILQILPKMYRRVLVGKGGPPGRPFVTEAARPALPARHAQRPLARRHPSRSPRGLQAHCVGQSVIKAQNPLYMTDDRWNIAVR